MAALYLVFVGVHLALSRPMAGPVIETDEAGYLGVASLLARGTGLIYEGAPYHPGYGALLWPIERLTANPDILYRAALVTNALALSSLVVAAYLLTGWLVKPEAKLLRTVISVLVGIYPPFLAYGNVAIELSVFVPLCLFAGVAVAWAASRESIGRWGLAGLVAGATFAVHPVGGFVVLAVLIVAGGARRPWIVRVRALVGVLAGTEVTGLFGTLLINRVVHYQAVHLLRRGAIIGRGVGVAIANPTAISRSAAVVAAISRNGFVRDHGPLLGYEIAGQLWYLIVGSVGLVVIGSIIATRDVWRVYVHRSLEPADVIGAFAGPLLTTSVLFSAQRYIVGANGGGQADGLIYGRYNDQVVAVVLVLGLTQLARMSTVSWRTALAWSGAIVAATAVCGLALVEGRTARALDAPIVYANVFALDPILHLFGRVDVGAISLIGVVAAVAIVALARWKALAAVAPFLLVAGLASGIYSTRALTRESVDRTQQRVILHALAIVERVAGRPTCIGYDLPIENNWTTSTDQLYLPRTVFHRFDSLTGEAPCSELALSQSLDLAMVYPGARLMALENSNPVRLWVLPGHVQDALARAGDLLPAGFPTELPDSAYASEMLLVGPAPVHGLAPGAATTISVRVSNVGTGSPWPSSGGFTSGSGWVSIATAWRPVGTPPGSFSHLLATGVRTEFSEPLWPGESEIQAIKLKAVSAAGVPLPPGRYDVTIGLVQEGLTFFAAHGDRPVVLVMEVV